MKKYFYLACFFFLLSAGCDVLTTDPDIPTYIYIDKFSFTCDLDGEGYPSENISDGWVYVNNKEIGVFQLPVLIPVLDSGEADIIVYPGIKDNGSSATRKIYPFYKAFTATIDLQHTTTDTVHPATSYYPEGNTFLVLDRFEIGNAFSTSINSDTSFVAITDSALVFEGNRSLKSVLENDNYFFRAGTFPLIIPDDGRDVYLELDYRCDTQFEIWLNGTISGSEFPEYVITISPKDDWNKIYVNLSLAARLIQADTYSLEIRQSRPTAAVSATIYIDNLKIIAAD